MEIINTGLPLEFIKFRVEQHYDIKQALLDKITSMGIYSLIDKNQSISNTDYHLNESMYYNRQYTKLFAPILSSNFNKLKNYFKMTEDIIQGKLWFQQYKKLDYHNWHIHPWSNLSGVYYLDLPNGASKTTFRIGETEFQVDVSEGDILIWPAWIPHTSKPNQSEHTKTVIAFNLN
jgi:hypothetical protein